MIVPDLKGAAKGLLEPLNFTETLTSTFDSTTALFARKTGIFGRRSRHAAILDETGPKRSVPTAISTLEGAGITSETVQVEKASFVAFSAITPAPEITPTIAEIEGRQIQATRSVANDDVTTIKTTALIFIESSTTRTILTVASTTTSSPTPTSSASSTVVQTTTSTTSAGPTPTTPTSSTPVPTAISSPSAKPPAGAIAGGAIGGFAALLFALLLIAFLVRRHRKKIERRRLESANPFFPDKTSTPPPPIYQDRPGGHNRSNSTSHDIYGTMGGGVTTSSRTNFSNAERKGRLIDMNSLQANPAPGLRAEGGPGLPPAAFLRPAQMLDGRPINEIGGTERPRSVRSTTSGSRFEEHLAVEMEDTSSFHTSPPTNNIQRAPPPPSSSSIYSQDSPILGRNSAFSTTSSTNPPSSLASDVTRRQHLMSWSTYASDGDDREEMSATLNSSKTPPSARSSPSGVSPQQQHGGQVLGDSSYVVSPLRRDKF